MSQVPIFCPFCGDQTAAEPDFTTPSYGVLCLHRTERREGAACLGSGQTVLLPSPSVVCPACGDLVSLAIRSRSAMNQRKHDPADCVAALRARIEKLEKAAHFHDVHGASRPL